MPPGQDELPYDDGEPMESEKHLHQLTLLLQTLRIHLGDRKDIFVGGNMGVYYSMLQARRNDFKAPDVFVVLDAVQNRERKSWVVWEEEGRTPNVVIELLSPSTEANDRGPKMRVYARALRVPEYFLFDPETNVVEGYTLDTSRWEYTPMERDVDGGYHSEQLGLGLHVVPGTVMGLTTEWLRWTTPQGEVLPNGPELAAQEHARAALERSRAEQEHARAEQERSRADREADRARRLADQLRSMGVDPDA